MTQAVPSSKFNHMSFPATDVAATAAFFETYLGFRIAMAEPDFCIIKRPGLDVVIEKASKDASTIQALGGCEAHEKTECNPEDPVWPRAFHIGLELPTIEDVRALRERFVADGFNAETEIFNNGRGSRFFLCAPGGIMVEFNTRSDAAEQFRGTFD